MHMVSTLTARIGLALLAALVSSPALAFKPNDAGHLGITTDGLTPITRSVDGATLRFSEAALSEIREANRDTDVVTFFGVAEHFDDEAFRDSSTRLQDLKESAIEKLLAVPPDGFGARRDFGGALHTVQDYYSHSNWVELGRTTIDERLGREIFDSLPPGEATCPQSPGTLGGAGLVAETTGYFPFPDPCAGPPDGTPAGKCRHGLEFFCPDGLNKDAPGRVGFEPARALAIEATTDYANQLLDDPRIATNPTALRALMTTTGAPEGLVLAVATGLDRHVEKVFDVPVDTTIASLEVRSTVAAVEVRRPSGAVVSAGDPEVTITDVDGVRHVAIEAPEVGDWTIVLPRGQGKLRLDVLARSDLRIGRFAFVTLGGRIGHEGFVALSEAPVRKSANVALARLTGSFTSVAFELVDEKGDWIDSTSLYDGDLDAGTDEWIGLVQVPNKPFRLAIDGVDASGVRFRRVSPVLVEPRR